MIRLFYLIIFHTLLFIITYASLQAQTVEPKFDQLSPIFFPNCVLQDSYGFIWIGAQEGLIRYDGYHLKRFTNIPFDSTSLSNSWVTALGEDKKGNLWIATWGGGLNYFNQKTQKFTRYMDDPAKPNTIGNNIIPALIINDDGSLWLGTLGSGLIKMILSSNGTPIFKYYDLCSSPDPAIRRGENFVLDLYKDRQGKLWIGKMEGGLNLLDPITGNLTQYKHDPNNSASLSSNTVSSICEDDSGYIWIGTGHVMWPHGKGISKLDPFTRKIIHFKHDQGDPFSLSSNNISSLLIDDEGVLWISTVDNYLNSIPITQLHSSQKPQFTHYINFDEKIINSIYKDCIGNIWLTSFGRSLYKYDQQQSPFIWYRHIERNPNSLSDNWINLVDVDKSGDIWFGTHTLDRYDPDSRRFTQFQFKPDTPLGLKSNRMYTFCVDKYGSVWIGSSNGLFRSNPQTGIFFEIPANPEDPFGLKSEVINELLVSRSGNIWIASAKTGLQLFNMDENRFYSFNLDTNSTEDENLLGIYEDQSGIMWSYTWNFGLHSFRMKDHQIVDIKHYIHNPIDKNSLSCNLISDIIRPQVVDTKAVWIATSNGLNRLDLNTETFKHLYTKDGLPTNYISKLLEDDEGNIWISCDNDIAVYHIKTAVVKSYGKGDGMPITSFDPMPQNACKTPDGQLIFGSIYGALGFYPDQLKDNTFVPPIYLTDFKIYNEKTELDTAIQFKKKIILAHNQNMFSFEFAALNFTNPEKNQYAYKMKGLYDDWIQLKQERTVGFTNLDPGEYTFRVKGSNNHGIWNEEGTSIRIIIDPPFWQTAWFRIILGILFISILVVTIRYFATRKLKLRLQELEYQRKLDGERERISKDMHDEVGSSLTRIAILSELAKKEMGSGTGGKQRIEDISQSSRQVVDNIGEIIWAINPQNDTLENLIAYTRQFVSNYFEVSSIHCQFDLPQQIPELSLSAEFRRNIFLVIKEAITNILKHACASQVLFQIQINNRRMTINITDNGKGFSMEALPQFGNGLTNMKKRIEQLGGKWEITSKPGEGAKIHMAINFKNENRK